ncbi:uncharacterized protein rab11fip1b [Salminus brasiliensis]|uniref:uncharacterized protein rab11fip1b n=1 Tax=Salminus brasiliensis TaxID=930266 RepID=UPI003B82F312
MSLADQSQQWLTSRAKVCVLQARGLRIKGKLGTDGAHALLQVGAQKFSTAKGQQQRADPVWDGQEAAFELAGFPESSATLRVQVLQRALVGPDKLLGQTDIDLGELYSDRSRDKTQWFKLFGKPGKPEKDRGEIQLDIQFLKGSMSVSMFDLSGQDKSRSKIGKLKDKLRGKKKEGLSDSASAIVPSVTQILTDSEGEEEEGPASSEKKKKNKLKSLFAPKASLHRNTSQSMSTLSSFPERDSAIASSSSSGLNAESPEGKKKFKFLTHKRNGSTDSKASQSGFTFKQGGPPQVCINGSHVYMEEPEDKGSTLSLTSSGHGSMEELRRERAEEERIRAEREEEERQRKEREAEEQRRKIEEERMRRARELEEQRRKTEEEQERMRMERAAEEQRRKAEEERERMRMEREAEEQRRKAEEERERMRMEREAEEQRRKAEEERERVRMEREAEEQRRKAEEERERVRMEREAEEQRRKAEEKRERMRMEREAEEQRRKAEEERERVRMEREAEEQRRMRMEREAEEQRRKAEEERERMRMEGEAEEQRRKAEEERERMRMEREAEEQRRKAEEEEKVRKVAEEKRKRVEEEGRIRKEEEEKKRLAEEKRVREEEERRRKSVAEQEEAAKRKRAEAQRVCEEEERVKVERKREEEEEEKRIREAEERKEKERVRLEEERRSVEMEGRKRKEREMREEEERKKKEREMREEEERKKKKKKEREMKEREMREEEERKKKEREMREEEERKKKEREMKEQMPVPKARTGKVSTASKPREEPLSEGVSSTNQSEWSASEEPASTNPFEEPTIPQSSASVRSARVSAVKPSASVSRNVSQPSVVNTNPFLDDDDDDDDVSVDGSFENLSSIERSTERTAKKERAPLPPQNKPEMPKPKPARGILLEETKQHSPSKEVSKRPAPAPPGSLRKTTEEPDKENQCTAALGQERTTPEGQERHQLSKAPPISKDQLKAWCIQSMKIRKGQNSDPDHGQAAMTQSTSHCGHGDSQITQKPADTNPFTCGGPVPARHNKGPAPAKPPATCTSGQKSEVSEDQSSSSGLTGDPAHPEDKPKVPLNSDSLHNPSNFRTVEGLKSLTDTKPALVLVVDQGRGLPGEEQVGEHLKKMDEPESLQLSALPCTAQEVCPESLASKPDSLLNLDTLCHGSEALMGVAKKKPQAPLPPAKSPNQPLSLPAERQSKNKDVASTTSPSHTTSTPLTFTPLAEKSEMKKVGVSVSADPDLGLGSRALPLARVVPTDVQSSAGDLKGAGGASASVIRPHAVKPLSTADKQPDLRETNGSKAAGGAGDAGGADGVQPKAEAAEAVAKGPYSQLTHAELVSLLGRQQEQLSQRDLRIVELEQYIDKLLVRVMEEQPSILMSLSSQKKAM